MQDDDHSTKTTAPKTQDEWRHIWDAAEKAHKSWIIVGPFHAAVANWKAWVIIMAVAVYVNKPEIIAVLDTLIGVP
jgi:hypothetical protein